MPDLICPDDNTPLKREYGISGVVLTCPKCKKEYIKCLDRLMSREEFYQRVRDEQ